MPEAIKSFLYQIIEAIRVCFADLFVWHEPTPIND